MNRAERKRQAKEDEKDLANGIDPTGNDAAPIAAMARYMHLLFEKAKHGGDIDEAVKFLYAKATATLSARPIQVTCARGCSHCCNGWVSLTAPEILFAAKRVRKKGDAVAARVREAYEATHAYAFAERPNHQHPCPMLEDNVCGLYDLRPFACRLASSMDASACERVLRLLAPETIPSPMLHVRTREFYQLAVTCALMRAGLAHRYYDFTGGLARALSRDDAEEAWLSGEDVFDGIQMDPTDPMTKGNAQLIYRKAFG